MYFVNLFLTEVHSKEVLGLHLCYPDCQWEVMLSIGIVVEFEGDVSHHRDDLPRVVPCCVVTSAEFEVLLKLTEFSKGPVVND